MVKSRKVKNIFQSTPSVGRATTIYNADIHLICISIHALRGEGDVRALELFGHRQGISIHALRGEGDAGHPPHQKGGRHFNPHPPWGGRPMRATVSPMPCQISIHALRGEGDVIAAGNILPRVISIHALRGEGDFNSSIALKSTVGFQSTPSVGRATISNPARHA